MKTVDMVAEARDRYIPRTLACDMADRLEAIVKAWERPGGWRVKELHAAILGTEGNDK